MGSTWAGQEAEREPWAIAFHVISRGGNRRGREAGSGLAGWNHFCTPGYRSFPQLSGNGSR